MDEPGSASRRGEKGKRGEDIAANYLTASGYAIVERNYRAGHNEIDIIAARDGCTVFCEVKARDGANTSRFGRPAAAVDMGKRRRTAQAAREYLKTHKTSGRVRFDVIEVYLESDSGADAARQIRAEKIHHIKNAFRAEKTRENPYTEG